MAGDDLDQDRMVAEQIQGRGVRDPRVLAAMRSVPRRAFVPDHLGPASLADHALPIGHRQTISQPYIVGKMVELLRLEPDHVLLEIGTGSGYQAAVLSRLVSRVISVEIIATLAEEARSRLKGLGFDNVEVRMADGSLGYPKQGPYDRICLTAAPVSLPECIAEQLVRGGRLVAPVGQDDQRLVIWDRLEDGFEKTPSIGVRFVPMTGAVTHHHQEM